MRKTFTLKFPISAEQFDGSKEMIERYQIVQDVQYTDFDESGMEYTAIDPFTLPTLDQNFNLKVGDWIVEYTSTHTEVIPNKLFNQLFKITQ